MSSGSVGCRGRLGCQKWGGANATALGSEKWQDEVCKKNILMMSSNRNEIAAVRGTERKCIYVCYNICILPRNKPLVRFPIHKPLCRKLLCVVWFSLCPGFGFTLSISRWKTYLVCLTFTVIDILRYTWPNYQNNWNKNTYFVYINLFQARKLLPLL